MLREYEVVSLKRAVPSVPLLPGTEGTVLIAHPSDPPAYEVEFVDKERRSLGIFSVKEGDLEVVRIS